MICSSFFYHTFLYPVNATLRKAPDLDEKQAIVALVVPFGDTVMGPSLVEEPPSGVPATYEENADGLPLYVQVREKAGYEPIVHLSSLKAVVEPASMPELLYERHETGQAPPNFGFVYEHNGKNRAEEREKIRFTSFYAGSGGFNQAILPVAGFETVASVDPWKTAW